MPSLAHKTRNLKESAETGPFPRANLGASFWRNLQLEGGANDDSSGSHRPCGSVIDVIPAATVIELATTFTQAVLTQAGLPAFLSRLLSSMLPDMLPLFTTAVKYDLQVVKVCGQCSDVLRHSPGGNGTAYFSVLLGVAGAGTYDSYCGPQAYGVPENIVQSGIALIPMQTVTDPTTGNIDRFPVSGMLRPAVFMHETMGTVSRAPSVAWPDNFGAEIDSLDGDAELTIARFFTTVAGIICASTGAVTGAFERASQSGLSVVGADSLIAHPSRKIA
jgi:hypothetical protein